MIIPIFKKYSNLDKFNFFINKNETKSVKTATKQDMELHGIANIFHKKAKIYFENESMNKRAKITANETFASVNKQIRQFLDLYLKILRKKAQIKLFSMLTFWPVHLTIAAKLK